MAVLRPIGKNTRIALFEREAVEGVYVDPTRAQHFVSEGLKYTPSSIEDPSNIGKVFTSDMVKTGYSVEGSVEMKAHPYFIGDAMYFTLGKDSEPENPARAYLLVWYNGSSPYLRIKKVSTDLIAEKSSNGVDWVADTAFSTTGTHSVIGDSVAEIAEDINAFTGYKAEVLGDGTAPSTLMPEFTAEVLKSGGIMTGACITPFPVVSGIAKSHYIYADDSAVEDIPSFSGIIDRNFGEDKDIGLSGCKISSLGLTFEPKNLVGLSLNIKAKHQSNTEEIGDLAIPASRAFTTNLSKIFVGSLVAQEVKDSTITINNNMFTDESVGEETFKSQGRQGASIELSGNLNLTVSDDVDEETVYLQREMQADRPVEYIAYMEASDYADLTLKAKYSVLIRVRAMKLTDCSPVITGPERLTLPFSGQAVAPIIGRHLDVWVVNKQTTPYTPVED
jgi:hypothetical protein